MLLRSREVKWPITWDPMPNVWIEVDVKHLLFEETVEPRTCYTQMCTKGSILNTLAAGGMFCVGERTKTFGDMTSASLVEFAMSYSINPSHGAH